MKKWYIAIIVFMTIPVVFLPLQIPGSNAESAQNAFELKLLNETNNDLTDPLFSNVSYHFDTICNSNGTIYRMKAMFTLDIVPARLVIISEAGLYNVDMKITGLTSWAAGASLKFTLTSDDNTYSAILTQGNNFNQSFKDEDGLAKIQPNEEFVISACVIENNVETTVPPESLTDIEITFEANLSDGSHQVMFISEGEILQSYIVPDDYMIQTVPTPNDRTDYAFINWSTEDGRVISPGFTVTSNDGDIIAYAKWDYIGADPTSTVYPIVSIIVAAIIATLLLVIIIYKRKRYPE